MGFFEYELTLFGFCAVVQSKDNLSGALPSNFRGSAEEGVAFLVHFLNLPNESPQERRPRIQFLSVVHILIIKKVSTKIKTQPLLFNLCENYGKNIIREIGKEGQEEEEEGEEEGKERKWRRC